MEILKRRRRARRTRLSILLVVFFAVLTYALGYFSSNPKVTIHKINVTGNRIINQSDIEDFVKQKLSGKYFHLFSRSNTFIYPKDSIYEGLINAFPRIENLAVYRDDWNTVHIDILERSGSSLYCGTKVPDMPSDVGENCYFINNDGYIFDKAPYFSGNIYFKYYSKLDVRSDSPLGQQLFPPEIFHNYVRFIDGITALGFKPLYFVLTDSGDSYLYLDHGPSDTAPEIIFKNDADLSSVLSDLTLSMKKPEFATDIKSKYTTLLYIDLRFKNKILYKFE